MRCFLLSRAALPASSNSSAAMYSARAARTTEQELVSIDLGLLKRLLNFPTGNWSPALAERLRLVVIGSEIFPFPLPGIVSGWWLYEINSSLVYEERGTLGE